MDGISICELNVAQLVKFIVVDLSIRHGSSPPLSARVVTLFWISTSN
jgi:hypothetical protein